MSAEESDRMRSKAYSLCRDYLLGAWKLINEDTMVIRQIRWVPLSYLSSVEKVLILPSDSNVLRGGIIF